MGRRRRVAALVAALALIAFAVGVFFVVRGRTVTGAATTLVLPPPRGLAIGLDEENANLLGADGGGPAFAPWRERLDAISPTFVRLDVVWSKLQPAADVAPDWNAQQSGCLRAVPPCAAYPGLRGQLRALAARQRADPGRFLGYVVFFGAPSWATAPRHGCVPSGAGPTALALSDAGRRAYGRLAAGVLRVAREEGADLRYWSAWNEPNQPAFLSPQRAACRVDAPPLSPGAYAALVGELRAALDESPGDQQLALGETAAYDTPRPTALSTVEFIDGLPQDVVCASNVWAQHAYVGTEGIGPAADLAGDPGRAGSAALLTAVQRALDRRGCGERKRVWITETGVGGPKPGGARPTDTEALRRQCQAMAAALATWYRSPRVDAAFQYTFREDDSYPVGLVDTGLKRAYPTYDLWRAWGRRAFPTDEAPALPRDCR
ncbi:MAG: hypothetical protein ACJ76K_06435 [Solirubrobacteraceae bacterium]